MRVYIVEHKENGSMQFVRAKTLSSAIRAIASETFSARSASTEEMFQGFKQGLTVIDAAEEEEEPKDE